MVDLAFWVEQRTERCARLLQPGAGQRQRTKGDNQDLSIELLELVLMLAQLSHVFSAGQSAQVA
jgi:hypothetical protein